MQQKVELNKVRNFGEIIDDSILFFKQNWRPLLKSYFTICGFFWVTGLVLATFNQIHSYQLIQQGESTYDTTFLVGIIFEVINFTTITITSLSFISLYHHKGKEAPTVDEVWGYVKFYFIRVFFSSLLLGALLVLGTICCIFPGIYLWPVFSLILTIMVIDNTSFRYAFNQGFQLIKDNWGHVFGVLIVNFLLVAAALLLLSIPALIIGGLIVFLNGKNGEHTITIALTISTHMAQFLYLFPFISMTLVFFSLTEHKDESSLMQRIKMLGRETPPAQQPTTEEEY